MVEFRIPTDIPDPQPRSRTGYVSVVISPSRYLVSGVADFGDVSAHYSGSGRLRVGQRVRVDAAPDLHNWEIRAIGADLTGPPPPSDHEREQVVGIDVGHTQARGTSRAQVIVDVNTVYQFFKSGSGFAYAKSMDGGETWGATVVVSTGSVETWDIFYERWANPAADDIVHIVYGRFSDTWQYTSLDLSDDSLSTPVDIFTGADSTANFSASICQASDGTLWVAGRGNNPGAFTYRSDDAGATWTSVAAFGGATNDRYVLWPDRFTDDDADFLGVYHDSAAGTLGIRRYDASAQTTTHTNILSNVAISRDAWIQLGTTMGADGKIYAVSWDVASMGVGSEGDLRSFVWDGTSGSAGADLVNSEAYGVAATLSMDQTNERVYAFYSRDADAASIDTSEVYYRFSDDQLASWSEEFTYAASEESYRFLFSDPIPNGMVMPGVAGGSGGGTLSVNTPIAIGGEQVTAPLGQLGADEVTYSPGTDADWADPNPSTVQEALDRIAAVVAAQHGAIA